MAHYGIDEILTAKAPVNLRILGGFAIYVDGGVDGILRVLGVAHPREAYIISEFYRF